jgi:anti-anti-sigma factor
MNISIKRKIIDPGIVNLKFDGEVTIYSVGKLKKAITSEILKSDEIRFDLSGVTQIDTSGFQLLIYLREEIRNVNKTLSVINTSNEVDYIFTLFNEKI